MVLAMGGLDNMIRLYCGERTGRVSNSKFLNLQFEDLALLEP
jgi:hypothetical protein